MLDREYIRENINTNAGKEVPFIWSHGAKESHIGGGIIYYALVYYLRAKICLCLGSGGGFVPRLMAQAHFDLRKDGIFKKGEGIVYVVDAIVKAVPEGYVDWEDNDSFFRKTFNPVFIKKTTEQAFFDNFIHYEYIDYLHIDASHEYEDVSKDFILYSRLINKNGIITLHDTDKNFSKNVNYEIDEFTKGPSKLVEELDENYYEFINLFNSDIIGSIPASTGITIVRKK